MISLQTDRERRMELLKMAGGDLERAKELDCWVEWGCSAEEMRSMADTATPEQLAESVTGITDLLRGSATVTSHVGPVTTDTAPHDPTVQTTPTAPAEPDLAIPEHLRRVA